MKSTYQIKETKNKRIFSYTGDLAEAIEKAKKDLRKEKENPEIPYWIWIKGKAQKQIEAHNRKIERREALIRIAEKHLKEERENEKATQERKQDT